MRYQLSLLALAAALCGTAATVCADEAKPAAPAPSPLLDAILPAMREMQAADDSSLNMVARLKRFETFHHSPETAARLVRIFGTDHPLSVTRLPPVKNQLAWRIGMAPLHYTGPDGASLESSPLEIRALTDKAGRRASFRGSWPSVDGHDKDGVQFTMRNATMEGKQHQGYAGLWFGDARVDVERISIEPKRGDAPTVTMQGLHSQAATIEHARTVDERISFGIKAINAGGEQFDDFRVAMRITNLDKRALVTMRTFAEKNRFAKLSPQQKVEQAKPMLKEMAKAIVKSGASIDIDDISAGYLGNRASIKGRVTVEGAQGSDFDAFATLLKRVVARFEVKVPVALVRSISGKIAQHQQKQQHPGNAPDPQAAAQMGQTMTDVVVGKLLGAGYAKLENDVLVSTIEWRDGKLTANGKEVALPKRAPARKPGGGQASDGGHWMQARRVTDSCKLPDYPDEVVRENKPLQFTLRFMVGADGHVRNLSMLQSSQLPDYDKAVLAAAANCTYIPALHDGKPAEVPMTWSVVREPDSARP